MREDKKSGGINHPQSPLSLKFFFPPTFKVFKNLMIHLGPLADFGGIEFLKIKTF